MNRPVECLLYALSSYEIFPNVCLIKFGEHLIKSWPIILTFQTISIETLNLYLVLDGISILLKVQVIWVSEFGNYAGSCLPAVEAIHPGPVWHKMIRDILALWPSSLGVGVGPDNLTS